MPPLVVAQNIGMKNQGRFFIPTALVLDYMQQGVRKYLVLLDKASFFVTRQHRFTRFW